MHDYVLDVFWTIDFARLPRLRHLIHRPLKLRLDFDFDYYFRFHLNLPFYKYNNGTTVLLYYIIF